MYRRNYRLSGVVSKTVIPIALALALIFCAQASRADTIRPAAAAVVWDNRAKGGPAHDQSALLEAATALGFCPRRIAFSTLGARSLEGFNVLFVPHASARYLSEAQVVEIVKRVRGGLNLVLDDYSPLSARLGIQKAKRQRLVGRVYDIHSREQLIWRQTNTVMTPILPRGSHLLYRDSAGSPMGASFHLGDGRCLFLATLFDPWTDLGYGRYPTLPRLIRNVFPLRPRLVARDLEVYFDPDYHFGQGVSIERLALRWKNWGVRVIHAAAWHSCAGDSYDFARLIKACHANGIKVYAWFELPHVNAVFYEDHPEWREKTATGADSMAGWRSPVALEDPACRKAVMALVTDLLRHYDWDGVNLAELYFDSYRGPQLPAKFVPFHPSFRREFQSRYGYDPREICRPNSRYFWRKNPAAWEQFASLRSETLTTICADVLRALKPFEAKGKEIVVTVIDTIGFPEMKFNLGMDAEKVIGLMSQGRGAAELKTGERFNFTLNVEDPYDMWFLPPNRYIQVAARYRPMIKVPNRLMLNVNIVEFRKAGRQGFTSSKQLGMETFELMRIAKAAAGRVIFYCESSIPGADARLLSAASASVDCCYGDGKLR
jgi:hypothetical protein